ncbi:MAG: GatB/YqeY domain-containing protein [Saprospiraceae bacterium]|nr:GatB/YqeY domain-containing protein [Saprospiraceae bacterium]
MSLESRIMQDLKVAMKQKDQASMRAIRAIKSAILLRKTDGSGTEITDEEEIKLLQKLVKSRKESLDIYQKQNREDLAKVEEEEIIVIEKYLPAAMNEQEAEQMVIDIITETGAVGMKDMGKVMSLASSRAAGRVDGKFLAQLVRNKLS